MNRWKQFKLFAVWILLVVCSVLGCGDDDEQLLNAQPGNDDGEDPFGNDDDSEEEGDSRDDGDDPPYLPGDDVSIPDETGIRKAMPLFTEASGDAYRFDWSFTMLPGAEVSVLERPDIAAVTTSEDGFFEFEGLHVGDDVTLVANHPDFFPTQTATLTLTEEGIDDLAFQIPPRFIVWGLSLVLLESLDPTKCQIASTVTEAGGTPFSPGLAGATVRIDPPLPKRHGPFYFKIFEEEGWPLLDLPVRGLTETTGDGGVVFMNVPPGEYVLTAERGDEVFAPARVTCRAGMLVNAAPPYGLTRVE